jgi:hypothetical protein
VANRPPPSLLRRSTLLQLQPWAAQTCRQPIIRILPPNLLVLRDSLDRKGLPKTARLQIPKTLHPQNHNPNSLPLNHHRPTTEHNPSDHGLHPHPNNLLLRTGALTIHPFNLLGHGLHHLTKPPKNCKTKPDHDRANLHQPFLPFTRFQNFLDLFRICWDFGQIPGQKLQGKFLEICFAFFFA